MDIKSLISKIKIEEKETSDFLHLTANEAQLSKTAFNFVTSKLSERYFFGGGENGVVNSGGFYGRGLPAVQDLINEGIEAAKRMLGAYSVNLNCLSGVHAMMCAILSTTEPGDTIMTVHHDHGGHFATKGIIERVGRKQVFASYNLEDLRFDTEKMAKDFRENSCKALYLDVSYYLNPHNLKEIRAALGDEAIIIFDASHTMGIIMGQRFQAPLKEGANVVCANTHKTLPGPQKGMIAFRDADLAEKANAIIDGYLFSSPHTHHMLALATTILELEAFGQDYADQIIKNSNAVAQAFVDLGYEVRKSNTGAYSHNHQAHIFIDKLGDPAGLYKKLLNNNISTNFDSPLGGRTFIRIGSQEVTRRGMKEGEMKTVASLIDRSLKDENVKSEVQKLNSQFQEIKFSFDNL